MSVLTLGWCSYVANFLAAYWRGSNNSLCIGKQINGFTNNNGASAFTVLHLTLVERGILFPPEGERR